MTVTLKHVIQHLRPGTVPFRDFILVDRGNGAEIERWTHGTPQPTAEEIAAVDREALDAARAKADAMKQVDAAAGDIASALAEALLAKGALAKADLPAEVAALLDARKALDAAGAAEVRP